MKENARWFKKCLTQCSKGHVQYVQERTKETKRPIFAVAGMLNNNFTQIYVFQNVLNMPASQVIDTYVYNVGLKQFNFGIGTAASLMKSVLAILLLFGANFVSGKLTDSSLF